MHGNGHSKAQHIYGTHATKCPSALYRTCESKFGPEKASTLNMYAIMKSGFKEVDNSQP
ncbi:hypothetical protein BDA96_01G157200 [Sorghum bicolor]|uniref:Uncharacterized protein n=2 Tax=Sorghum bicolor TaxID=4558 RepID=A0A921RYV8_SORBI|nr:hypothetical protein SORBI_3001G149901 [Sorghum bicolor]KAG0548326.1 hypothetical protein BDA96_01G157200 [Sorghum bicolor]